MSDFAKFCPKCYAFFRDPDLYAKHVEVCGVAKKKAGKETADGRPQSEPDGRTAAEVKKTRSRQTATVETNQEAEKVENTPETVEEKSAADCGLPSADSTEGGSPPVVAPKSSKFKT
jgi:hypothetical protein